VDEEWHRELLNQASETGNQVQKPAQERAMKNAFLAFACLGLAAS